jgi:hypothetical protein
MTLYLSTLSYFTSVTDAAGDVRAHLRVSHTCSEAGTEVFAQSKKLSQSSKAYAHAMTLCFPSTSSSPVVVLRD